VSSQAFLDPADTAQWIRGFQNVIPFVGASGMSIRDLGKGTATAMMPARTDWTGDAEKQTIHPGCLSVLADSSCGMAVATALDVIEPFATLDLRMDYLRPALAERDLLCTATCHRLSRTVAFVRGELFQAEGSEPVATVNATFMRATAHGRRETSPEATRSTSWSIDTSAQVPALPPQRSPYVDFLGVQRIARAGEPPLFRLPFRHDLIGNPMLPALHGGVLAGFAETAAILHLVFTVEDTPSGKAPRGVDFSIDYLRSAKPIDTYAACTTVRLGARVALVQVNVWQEDPARPVATARTHLLLPATGG